MDNTAIKDAVSNTVSDAKRILGEDISDATAFSYVLVDNYFFSGDRSNIADVRDMVTDGANDGGIDFVVFDEDKPAVVVGQSKYTGSIGIDAIVDELGKMVSTVDAFKNGHYGVLNKKVKKNLQEAFDSLPDNLAGTVEYYFCTTSNVNIKSLNKKVANCIPELDLESLIVCQGDDIASTIVANMGELDVIKEDHVEIDDTHNLINYESNRGRKGMMANVSSKSIQRLYNLYIDKGLLSLNIRGYIRNASVDRGINRTLDSDRDSFWFYNNGLTIACSSFWRDGKQIKMRDFSIVNGGQTTSLIGKYSGTNHEEFFIPCKIVSPSEDEDPQEFYIKIAEATNSQKPIRPRDLRSNSKEMIQLQKWLGKQGVFLEIKRGDKRLKKKDAVEIKNEELGQLLLSFVYQQPGTARSGKRNIWENKDTYNKLFRQHYESDENKQAFLLDLIQLWERYKVIEKAFKTGERTMPDARLDALKNGRMAIFALFGILYDIVNKDITIQDIDGDTSILTTLDFSYGSFISNYKEDDIDDVLAEMIDQMTFILSDANKKQASDGGTVSISNMLKSDIRYRDEIVSELVKDLRTKWGEEVLSSAQSLLSRA